MSYEGSDVAGYSATRAHERTSSSKWRLLEEMTLELRWGFVCVCVWFLVLFPNVKQILKQAKIFVKKHPFT